MTQQGRAESLTRQCVCGGVGGGGGEGQKKAQSPFLPGVGH